MPLTEHDIVSTDRLASGARKRLTIMAAAACRRPPQPAAASPARLRPPGASADTGAATAAPADRLRQAQAPARRPRTFAGQPTDATCAGARQDSADSREYP
jgi:hypothetical protein